MVMNGYGQMVYDGMAPEAPLRGEMGEVLEAGKRAAALTGQLLMFSRQNRAEMQVVRLNKVLAGVARMLERLVGEDVVMELRLAEELGHIKADPRHLEQVVMNLAANARDAMPTGGTLAIETAPVVMDTVQAAQHVGLKPGRYAMLVVSDTGTGIKPEVAAHLFEPFFTTKEAGRGTGLGLSTVYAIVKESQGGIYVYSEWGQGTTFRIYLPLVDDPVTRATENRAVCLPRGSETILVVEDQEQVRRLVTQVLRQLGYRVLAAGGAEDALALYQEADQVHLVLTDVVMPHMSGPEVVERLRQLSPDLPALYMSGYAGQTISRHLAPGVPLVQKPFTAEQLAVQVRRVLDAGAPQGAPAS
jgi:CheY-like chemotaxis protein